MTSAMRVPTDIATGKSIRESRGSIDMSGAELTRRMNDLGFNWTVSGLSRIESGERRLRWDEAVALHTLGVDVLTSVLSEDVFSELRELRDFKRRVQRLLEGTVKL